MRHEAPRLATVRIGVRGHHGEPLVITRADRHEHVLDALFDDPVLEGLRRVDVSREAITLSFVGERAEHAADIVRTRVVELLGPPRWFVDQE